MPRHDVPRENKHQRKAQGGVQKELNAHWLPEP